MLPATGWLVTPIDNNALDVPLVLPVQYVYRDGGLAPIAALPNPKLPDGSTPLFIVVSVGNMTASIAYGEDADGSTGFAVTLFRNSVFGTLLVDTIYVVLLGPKPFINQETCPDVTDATDEMNPDPLSFSEETCGSLTVVEEVCGTLLVTEECP